jgi:hypothetical protein
MKAPSIHPQQSPSTGKVITRLALLGGFTLGGMYAVLQICTSILKIFE